MRQLQTDSIWEGFWNHQETVERRNQKEGTFIWDELFSFLSGHACIYWESRVILWELSHQALLFLEWHSSWSNHFLQSHGIPWQIFLPTACFAPPWISLPYFIVLILASRHFASGYPTCLNHMLIINASSGESEEGSDGHSCHFSHSSWVMAPGHFLLDSAALMSSLLSYSVNANLRINGVLIAKNQWLITATKFISLVRDICISLCKP